MKVERELMRGAGPFAVMKLLRRALKNLKDTFGDTESLGLPARALRTEGEERDAR